MDNETSGDIGPCPTWCAGFHFDGKHHAELQPADGQVDLPEGYHIYTRPIDDGEGGTGMEVVVVGETGDPVRIPFSQDEVLAEAARKTLGENRGEGGGATG